jgi:undecaprenyl-diphosphatase
LPLVLPRLGTEINDVFSGLVKSLSKFDEDRMLLVIRLLIVVFGSWAFLQLGHEVTIGATRHFDERIMLALRQPDDLAIPRGPPFFKDMAIDITALGGHTVLVLLCLIVVGFLVFLGGAALSGYLVGLGLKAFFTRPRPNIVPHLAPAYDTSFPSGHAMMSAIVYLTLGTLLSRLEVKHPRLRLYFIIMPLFLTGIVGASRVYLGVHYPTDVLAGWTAGLVWATLCSLVAQRLQRRGMIESEI